MVTTTREPETPEPVADEVDEPPPMSRGKYLGITALIVLTLLGMLASAAPRSEIKNGLVDLTQVYILATGLDQRWGVFAPNPSQSSNQVTARVDRADGTVGIYPLSGGNGITEYWDYRWRKYGEQLWKKRTAERERASFAAWVADQDRADGHQPVRVTLVRTASSNLPPGPGPDTGATRDIPFFSTPVSSR